MSITSLFERFRANSQAEALIWRDQPLCYSELVILVENWHARLNSEGVAPGAIVGLEATYSPNSVALLFALFQHTCIVALLTNTTDAERANRLAIAEAEWVITVSTDDIVTIEQCQPIASHPLIQQLRANQHPGLLVFTSGSTGVAKVAVHDVVSILAKYSKPRPALRTLLFLLFDHLGGINTLLHVLANGGCAVISNDLYPDTVATTIERHRVQVLPTTPTFLTLLLVSGVDKQHDLSSLTVVTYGTEAMPTAMLARLNERFPNVRFQQTYGLTELGVLRSKSRSSDSLWMKVGGEGYETRIVDGLLEIKAQSAMLGYLNAPAPFTEDGWYMTGDAVEVDGEWLRILGRKSELINAGGQKVYPAEVEGVLQTMEGVAEVAVKGEPNSLMGHIVTARVRLTTNEPLREFRTRMHAFCQGKLESYKVPVRVTLVNEVLHSDRFKKMR